MHYTQRSGMTEASGMIWVCFFALVKRMANDLQFVYIWRLQNTGLPCYTCMGDYVMQKHILIVEDDPAISKLIDTNLKVSGYRTVCAMDGQQALDAIHAQRFDLALCDIMLPELDGFELLPYMKEKDTPVIYVSAKADIQSRVQGLRLGAEDYLVKPFDILELLVRMEKVLARADKQKKDLVYRDIIMDTESHTVMKNGESIPVKHMEYKLLLTFLQHPGMVMTREDLLHHVWGDEYIGETRTVDVHVAALRRKLDLNRELVTVYKIGYRLEAQP